MGNCSTCPSNGSCGKDETQCGIENNPENKIKNIIFYVSLADSDNAEIMENYSAEQLNSYEKFITFKNRFQSKP